MRNNKRKYDQGYIGGVIVFLFIIALFVYYFVSNRKAEVIDIGRYDNEHYLNHNTLVYETITNISSNQIQLGEGESKDFKNRNFTISVNRGKNFKHENLELSCYIFEEVDTRNPTTAYQYYVIGIPYSANFYKYYVVLKRQKLIRG